MWKTTMLRKECFSNVKKTWDRLCCVDIMSKQLCTSVCAKQPDNKDWFLYLNMSDRVCRLKIRDFCEKQGSSEEPKFELIHDYYPGYPQNTIPIRMNPVIVGSKVYMWDGVSIPVESDEIEMKLDYKSNLNVYSFDPSASPPFSICEGPISRLIPPKCDFLSDREVYSIEEKIYVVEEKKTLLRVFDPVHQSWKDLPSFPCSPYTRHSVRCQFFCYHKLFIGINIYDTDGRNGKPGGTYIFDTREEKWEHTNEVMKRVQTSTIEFEGFLILATNYKVIAYKLDSNGIPNWKSYQMLHKITKRYSSNKNYLGKCDSGRIWLVACTDDGSFHVKCYATNITVFRVSVSNDTEGNQTLSVEIVAQGVPDFEPLNNCCSAFALCHNADRIESH